MHDRLPRLVAVTLLVCLVAASRLPAQAGLGHLEDATTAPKGMFRLRAITAWTRIDSRYGATGIEPLGASFTADSLGRSKFAPLEPIEDGIRSATQTPAFRLSLGRSRLDATGREEIVPLALEYGVTNRVAVSVLMPIVRRRVTMLFRLDSTGANVGPNLHRTSTTAAQTNVLVQTEFANAASQLQTRLTACQQNPSGAGCGAILAQAPALLTESQSFANTIATLYGSLNSTGLAFVPRSQSAEQAAIALRVTDFNLRYSALLGSDVIQAVPIGAAGPAGVSEFQNYLFDELRRDSLTSRELVGIGDVEIEFKFRVLDRPVTELRRLGVQLAIASGVRLPTGSRQSLSDVADLRLGQGQPVVDARAVLDAKLGRFGLTSIAQAAARQGEPIFPITGFVARDAFWAEIHVAPRWHVSEPFALHGAYSYRTTDQTGSDQLVGGGVSFMTLSSRRQGRAPPLEMRFTHLETVKGDPGRPRFFRDQLEVRIYYQLMSR